MIARPLQRLVFPVLALLAASACSAGSTTEIPFELSGNHVFIDVQLEGRTMSFLFDSGAQGTAVNAKSARTLGLEPTATAPAVGAGGTLQVPLVPGLNLEIGSLSLENIAVGLLPFDHLEEALGRTIDGIVGGAILEEGIVVLDYDRQILALHERGSFPSEIWGSACPVTGVPGAFRTEGEIELLDGARIAGRFTVDSGAGGFLQLATPFAREHALGGRVGPTHLIPSRALTASAPDNRMGHVRKFHFCGLEFPDDSGFDAGARLPVGLSLATRGSLAQTGFAGLLGNGILQRFNVAFDLARSRMFLRPNRQWLNPIQSDASGLFLVRPPGGRLRVANVVAGSPAAEAGILPGDLVRTIDGGESVSMELQAVRERFHQVGETRDLELERGGTDVSVSLSLRSLGTP